MSTFGALTDLQVWNMTLTAGDLTEWSDNSRPGNVLNWQEAEINNQGLLLVEDDDALVLQESQGINCNCL